MIIGYRTLLTFCLLASLSLGLAAVRPDQARDSRAILSESPPPFDHKISYGTDALEYGELRLPHDSSVRKPYPVAVVFHGGCWLAEYGLEYMGHLSADLAQSGIATWNVEYRRIGNSGGAWPGTFADAARSVDYLRVLAKSYPIDLSRVAVVGHSAGGHLGLWVAGRKNLSASSEFYTREPLPLVGVVALAGITDLRRTGTACDAQVQQLMHGSAEQQAATYDLASPLSLLPLRVPQTIIQGDGDRLIPPVMATAYVEAAKQKGDSAKLVIIEKAAHFELVDPKSAAWKTVKDEIVSMLNRKR